ncbi:efflux RND transporter periplasmic adaptor subunit [Paracidovorax valerianellae]|uniref:Membrane fusion protein, multidrug efflux system n=1 Tax=Paracidovorax valerianellae TaxID=187868 RepID=A0A1G7DYT3_9BURK|nr:efflux RND transporter periplasmic adaptor subunit [Paracidovorax valerianellae]MDA8444545.1 efflux RND transporter periplasmic adaptor subunit [Paracidovorax valerianellae]SDE56552.1 membrane fusion protein, multidrug efflux system [Paracidovorax valerianellae]
MNAPQTPNIPADAGAAKGRRRKALISLAVVVVLAGGAWGVYDWLVASHYEDTDNAYVQGNVIQITPQTGGTVMSILADDTDFVKAGAPLVKLDPADATVALEQAEAGLAQAVRQARTLYSNNGSLTAQINLRQADVAKARSDIARATDDLRRRQALAGNGAVSKEELNHAQNQLDSARTALAAAEAGVVSAREQLASNQSLTQGIAVDQNPNVLAAAAKVREAYLAARRTDLPAPVDGYVARRTVQLGQRVAAGTPLMTVVPLNQVWVDANFKENQLRNLRLGQPAKLTADLYGKKVEYTGTIAGMGVGTGSAFALLPAQNATGNWIKVVQRVPVRIALDAEQLRAHPLRVGLSMDVTVNTQDRSGHLLADAPRTQAVAQTTVYQDLDKGAEADVARIIAANAGPGYKSALAAAPAKPTGTAQVAMAPATTASH